MDVGGTFTDLVLVDEERASVAYLKVESSRSDPADAVLRGAAELIATASRNPAELSYFAHGTTIATNILLERRGAKTGLLTTEGFRDLFELARQKRPHLYDLLVEKPRPLVPRHLARGVRERTAYDGAVLLPLDDAHAAQEVDGLGNDGVDALAIAFLHSYANPAHEQRVADLVRQRLPGVFVSTSSDVLAEFREYERTSTTVVNAYVGPATGGYLRRLEIGLHDAGVVAPVNVCASNGGLMSMAAAADRPVAAIMSGPAAGVAGAVFVAGLDARTELLTMDIGGTSVDVSMVSGGRPRMAQQTEVGGLPVKVPMLDVHSAGAGGGSIARVEGGLLKVGPESAGSLPGPAAYGRGGLRPTVTDAQLVLGRLSTDRLLGDRLQLQTDLATNAIRAEVAEPLGLGDADAAYGIVAVMEAHLVRALRRVSVEAGHDPREFTLVAYGGAGPLHAASVAAELGMRSVLVPAHPGLLCAVGLLATDVETTFSRTRIQAAEGRDAEAVIVSTFHELDTRAADWLEHEKVPTSNRVLERAIDMRYEGQNHELTVHIPAEVVTKDLVPFAVARFHHVHTSTYGHDDPGQPVQFVTFRVFARGRIPPLQMVAVEGNEAPREPHARRSVYFPQTGHVDTPVYRRDDMPSEISGPAIIDQMDSTVVVPPGTRATASQSGNLLIEW